MTGRCKSGARPQNQAGDTFSEASASWLLERPKLLEGSVSALSLELTQKVKGTSNGALRDEEA